MAILGRQQLNQKVVSLFPDNTNQDISAADVRQMLVDLIDSFIIQGEGTGQTGAQIATLLNALTGDERASYTALKNTPILFDGTWASLSGKPTLFSGAFADLTGRPSANAYVPLIGTTGHVLTKTTTGTDFLSLPDALGIAQSRATALTPNSNGDIVLPEDWTTYDILRIVQNQSTMKRPGNISVDYLQSLPTDSNTDLRPNGGASVTWQPSTRTLVGTDDILWAQIEDTGGTKGDKGDMGDGISETEAQTLINNTVPPVFREGNTDTISPSKLNHNVVEVTRDAYNALVSKDATTLYIIPSTE